jgi:mannitol/fructose-specific phosphotransferase system IIA component (Ntr-type)
MSTKHDECSSQEEVFEAMIVKLEKAGSLMPGGIGGGR